jgi:hypothetical protein
MYVAVQLEATPHPAQYSQHLRMKLGFLNPAFMGCCASPGYIPPDDIQQDGLSNVISIVASCNLVCVL